jgi:hypothetical protein
VALASVQREPSVTMKSVRLCITVSGGSGTESEEGRIGMSGERLERGDPQGGVLHEVAAAA